MVLASCSVLATREAGLFQGRSKNFKSIFINFLTRESLISAVGVRRKVDVDMGKDVDVDVDVCVNIEKERSKSDVCDSNGEILEGRKEGRKERKKV